MPGLGDALGKAMEDSRRGLDDLVRRAAESEPESEATDATTLTPPAPPPKPPPAARPAPAGRVPERSAPVSREEKEFLVVSVEGGSPPPQPPPPAEGAAPADKDQDKTREMSLLDMPLEDPRPPSAPPSVKPPAPLPTPSPAAPPPARSAARSAAPSSASGEAIAPFAPSGVIRRPLRQSSRSGPPGGLLGDGTKRRSIQEELPQCRRVPKLPGAAPYRNPILVRGISGVVKVIAGGRAGRPALVTICGAAPGAGCSTVAAAVALELAGRVRVRVLLVDADFRSPGLGGLAGRPGGPGLAEVLSGGAALDTAVICSEAEGLAVLPLGGASGGTRLLSGPAMGRVLDSCRGFVDAVILDAGDAAGGSGVAALAGATGAAVLVVRSGQTGAREARAVRRTLEHAGAQVVGAVLNGAPAAGE
jgi:Mrp family chromosome partitioning ATPase